MITAPGDRRDEDILEVGRLASGLDHVIIKEDDNLRGRNPGEIANLIADGLKEKGVGENQIEIVRDELDSIEHALASAGEEDLVTILADDVSGVLEFLDAVTAGANIPPVNPS